MQQSCKVEHLEAIRPIFTYWTVDRDGNAVNQTSEDDLSYLEKYHCYNCGAYFIPDKQEQIKIAWEKALAHLTP